MSIGYLYFFLGEVSIQVSCPLFNWIVLIGVLHCLSSLQILDINPLSDISLENMFPHSVDWLFILLMVSFAVQKLFSLM